MSSNYQFLLDRRSVPSRQLGDPGPDAAQLDALLRAAVAVPDHGRLEPWRFIRVAGEDRARLGERLAAIAVARDPHAPAAALEKDRGRFTRAPLVLIVAARIVPAHKVPEQEQLLSAGCAAFNLLHAAHALGFGAQWITGWPAYDRAAAAVMGLSDDEVVVGFIHVGTAHGDRDPPKPRPEPKLAELPR
jgi:nitroreductase